jgi:hypothetical protein
MDTPQKRALVTVLSVLAVFVYHIGAVPATAELSAAALLAVALGGGVFIGFLIGNSQSEELKDIRKHIAKIRMYQEGRDRNDVVVEIDE